MVAVIIYICMTSQMNSARYVLTFYFELVIFNSRLFGEIQTFFEPILIIIIINITNNFTISSIIIVKPHKFASKSLCIKHHFLQKIDIVFSYLFQYNFLEHVSHSLFMLYYYLLQRSVQLHDKVFCTSIYTSSNYACTNMQIDFS